MTVGSSSQSASVCSRPSPAVARGVLSLMNITPCPTKTSSSIVTPVADEGVALDLAAATDLDVLLNLDERPDTGLVADPAAVEVREGLHDDAITEHDVAQDAEGGVVHRLVGHAKYSVTASTTAAIWVSLIPGKIGRDSKPAATCSVTGNEPCS